MITNVCKICGIEFVRPHNPNKEFKYCSCACMGKDKEKSKAHAIKMQGKPAWNKDIKGIQPWMNLSGLNNGIPWNKDTKGLQKAWNKGTPNPDIKGDKNPNWNGGSTKQRDLDRKSIRYKKWRISVFKRDSFTCTECGDATGGNLEAHHIVPYSVGKSLRYDMDNGSTLCKECHKETDSYLFKGRWVNHDKQCKEAS